MADSIYHEDPDYIEKGEMEAGKIVEIYSEFGLKLSENPNPGDMPSVDRDRLEEIYGNISNELLYLSSIDAVEIENRESIRLNPSEASLANKINHLETEKNIISYQILEDDDYSLPPYLSDPNMEEEFNEKTALEMNPSKEIGSRVAHAMDYEKGMTAEEVENSMALEVTSDVEAWLTQLELMGVAKKTDSGYMLRDCEEVREFLDRTEQEVSKSLKQEQRHNREPFKP